MITEKLSWNDAESNCKKEGGSLASVQSSKENEFLLELASQYKNRIPYWIGANDLVNEGQFVWSDGVPLSYSNWKKGHPYKEQRKRNCVSFWRVDGHEWDGVWTDNPCQTKTESFCKISKATPEPEPENKGDPEQGMHGENKSDYGLRNIVGLG